MAFDRTKANHLAQLKAEVNDDPLGAGYEPNGGTAAILELLNLVENNPQPSDTVNVPFDEFLIIDALDEIVKSEYDALEPRDKAYVDAIINAGVLNPERLTFGPVKVLFRKAFGTDSNTWLAVKDDRARSASRAEVLFGRDTVISEQDWFAARDS